MSIPFHYDSNHQAVVLFSADFRESGMLNKGEGLFGFPIEAFKRAAAGNLHHCDGETWRIVPLNPCIELVP